MFKRILHIALGALMCAPAIAREKYCESSCFKTTLCDIKHELYELTKAQSCTKIITAKDIGTTGYVIHDPGYYCLGEDVNFTAALLNGYAIQVLANNVTIDLEGHTLAQTNGDTALMCAGVMIGYGNYYPTGTQNFVLQNVTIKNGTIRDFSGYGVLSYNGSFDSSSYAQIPFAGLVFADLNVLGCGVANVTNYLTPGGITLNSYAPAGVPAPVAFENIVIDNCNVNQCFGNAAISVYTADSLVIRNTQANDLFCSNENREGAFAYSLFGTNIQMFSCQGNRATSYDQSGGGQVGGASIEASFNVYLKDCQFNSAYGETDSIVNNNLSLSANAVYENCQFNDNQGGLTVQYVTGVHCSTAENFPIIVPGVRFTNCQFNGASVVATNTEAVRLGGFFSTNLQDIIFDNCQACNIQTTGSASVVGMIVELYDVDAAAPEFVNAPNVVFRDCVVSDLAGTQDIFGLGLYGGFSNLTGTQIVQKNIAIENCIVQDLRGSTSWLPVIGMGYGLFNEIEFATAPAPLMYPQQFNLSAQGCRVSGVSSNGSPRCAGIIAEAAQNPVIMNNSVSDCDRGILLTGTTTIIPNGFELAATSADAKDIPPVYIPITAPTGTGSYTFTNLSHLPNNSVTITSGEINDANSFVFPAADLTALGWQPGDMIQYTNNNISNPDIGGLTNGTIYYAVVYIPGFSTRGVIQDNEVDNCTMSGYQDDSSPYTTSAWLNNAAVLNADNYAITWATGPAPIDTGSIAGPYPTPGNKYYNVSLNA